MKAIITISLVALIGLTQPAFTKESSPPPKYPPVNIPVLAGAKVQLCKDFAEKTIEYYMSVKMPKEYDTYRRATEFEAAEKEALRQTALRRIRDEAAAAFNPSITYISIGQKAYLSAYKRSPDGFEATLPTGSKFSGSSIEHLDGRHELIDLPRAFGLKDLLDSNTGMTSVSLQYAYAASAFDELKLSIDGKGTVFIPIEEAAARKIAENYRDAPQRLSYVDFYLRIEQCKQDKPGTNALFARIVGFDLFTAQLTKNFVQKALQSDPTWKRDTLIKTWRSPDWEELALPQ